MEFNLEIYNPNGECVAVHQFQPETPKPQLVLGVGVRVRVGEYRYEPGLNGLVGVVLDHDGDGGASWYVGFDDPKVGHRWMTKKELEVIG